GLRGAGRAWARLGVHDISAPMSFHSRVKLDFPVSLGGYRHARDPSEPTCLHLVHVPRAPNRGLDARAQFRIGQARLLDMTFADFEARIRDELDRMLGPGGFVSARDIAAITVNRWPHGYGYVANSLYDEDDYEGVLDRARQKCGRVAIANSDAGGGAYAHLAIGGGARAGRGLGGGGAILSGGRGARGIGSRHRLMPRGNAWNPADEWRCMTMIIQTAPPGEPRLAVMMHEHTALSGQFARAFGNDRFESVWPNDLMFYVVSHHDAGWAEFDRDPVTDETTGLPYNLIETPAEYITVTSRRSPDFNERHHPYCGLISSMHSWGLYNGRYGLSKLVLIDKIPPLD